MIKKMTEDMREKVFTVTPGISWSKQYREIDVQGVQCLYNAGEMSERNWSVDGCER